jgi:acetylornithine/succinyldiaminopimelate/putrescine aminotransferase
MAYEQCGPLFSKVAFDHGLLSVYANNDPRVSQLLPPLIIDRALATEIMDRVDQTLQVITGILIGR